MDFQAVCLGSRSRRITGLQSLKRNVVSGAVPRAQAALQGDAEDRAAALAAAADALAAAPADDPEVAYRARVALGTLAAGAPAAAAAARARPGALAAVRAAAGGPDARLARAAEEVLGVLNV